MSVEFKRLCQEMAEQLWDTADTLDDLANVTEAKTLRNKWRAEAENMRRVAGIANPRSGKAKRAKLRILV